MAFVEPFQIFGQILVTSPRMTGWYLVSVVRDNETVK